MPAGGATGGATPVGAAYGGGGGTAACVPAAGGPVMGPAVGDAAPCPGDPAAGGGNSTGPAAVAGGLSTTGESGGLTSAPQYMQNRFFSSISRPQPGQTIYTTPSIGRLRNPGTLEWAIPHSTHIFGGGTSITSGIARVRGRRSHRYPVRAVPPACSRMHRRAFAGPVRAGPPNRRRSA